MIAVENEDSGEMYGFETASISKIMSKISILQKFPGNIILVNTFNKLIPNKVQSVSKIEGSLIIHNPSRQEVKNFINSSISLHI